MVSLVGWELDREAECSRRQNQASKLIPTGVEAEKERSAAPGRESSPLVGPSAGAVRLAVIVPPTADHPPWAVRASLWEYPVAMATTLLNPLGMVVWPKLLYPQPTTVLAAWQIPVVEKSPKAAAAAPNNLQTKLKCALMTRRYAPGEEIAITKK
jgi:hypothetical protein